jgi:hypothetical protein
MCQLKVRDARRVVGLLGGRLVELNKAADALQDNDNWEGTADTEIEMGRVCLSPSVVYQASRVGACAWPFVPVMF